MNSLILSGSSFSSVSTYFEERIGGGGEQGFRFIRSWPVVQGMGVQLLGNVWLFAASQGDKA